MISDFTGVSQIIAAVGIVLVGLYQIWAKYDQSNRDGLLLLRLEELRLKQVAQTGEIHKIEVATNSMKDALVQATDAAARAAGEIKGRADQKAENHQLAQDAKLEEYQRGEQEPPVTDDKTK